MKRLSRFAVIVLLTLVLSNLNFGQETLTILHVNDTHSMLAPMGPRTSDLKGTQGGISRAAAVILQTKLKERNVLTLHGGDVFIGDLFFNVYFGAAEFGLMNTLGFDAMVLGNHEFDLTPAVLEKSLSAANSKGGFAVLSANTILDDPGVQSLKNYVKPYTIKTIGNVKAGIFGLTTPETNVLSQPAPAVISDQAGDVAGRMVAELISQGCSIIICLSHMGISYDRQIAAGVPGISVIISAHDHIATLQPEEITNPEGKTTYLVQANSAYSSIGKLKLLINKDDIKKVDYKLISLDADIPEDSATALAVKKLIEGIEKQYGPVYSQQTGTASEFLDETASGITASGGMHSTAIGRLVTDAFRWKTGTQIAIEAGGSTAQPVYPGPILTADIFRVVGYGFNKVNGLGYRIVTFNISGRDLWAALEGTLSQIGTTDDFFPQVSGMEFDYDPSLPQGSKIKWIRVAGEPVKPEAVYSASANEFLLYALTSIFGITVTDQNLYEDVTEFQVLKDYISSKGTISLETSKRTSPEVEKDYSPGRILH